MNNSITPNNNKRDLITPISRPTRLRADQVGRAHYGDTLMKKHISTLLLCMSIAAGMALATAPVAAQNGETTKSASAKHAKKPVAKKHAAKAVEKDDNKDEDGKDIDLAGSTTVDYHCDLGNKVTIYENNADEKHIAVRWAKHLHRLESVDTTTGAQRFENKKLGLVWIGIPAKSMLLDAKHGHQLANECKNATQAAAGPQQNTAGSLLRSDANAAPTVPANSSIAPATATK
ncbi:MAG: putative signal peptide protein [Herminiimonas sp.]|nr:putative signal peptide protein [Herminiimonas sp.]MDB5855150.1 putative signal peptide protein [Herminiimonas sp.]